MWFHRTETSVAQIEGGGKVFKDKPTKFLSVRLTVSQKQDLLLLARAEGIRPSEVIRRAIQERKEQLAGGATNEPVEDAS